MKETLLQALKQCISVSLDPPLLHAVLTCIGITLGCIPAILVATYIYIGLRRRADDLQAYVGIVVPSGRDGDPDRASAAAGTSGPPRTDASIPAGDLGHHLRERFNQANQRGDYVVAVLAFYWVYGVLIYWALSTWGMVLNDPPIAKGAFWDAVKLGGTGALGATLAAIWHLYWRVVRLDLVPRTFFQLSARLVAAPFLAIVLSALPAEKTIEVAPVAALVAFVAGAFGDEALRRLKSVAYKILNRINGDAALPLDWIQGIGGDDELRLREEGIYDVQNLGVCSVVTLATNTGYNLQRIVDWKNQAYLCNYVGQKIAIWRAVYVRGALDLFDLAEPYYNGADRPGLIAALATKLNVDAPVIERLIVSIYNDRQVYQLWVLAKAFAPEGTAEYGSNRPAAVGHIKCVTDGTSNYQVDAPLQ
jgi:hypothetical protein